MSSLEIVIPCLKTLTLKTIFCFQGERENFSFWFAIIANESDANPKHCQKSLPITLFFRTFSQALVSFPDIIDDNGT